MTTFSDLKNNRGSAPFAPNDGPPLYFMNVLKNYKLDLFKLNEMTAPQDMAQSRPITWFIETNSSIRER